jgi:L-iditol 2-dehydrogenase
MRKSTQRLNPERLTHDTMMSAMFYAPNTVRYEACNLPGDLAAGELLIKIDTALTCGTDIKCYRRGHPLLLKTFPSPFGHEFSGTVAKVSPPLSGLPPLPFKEGDRVVSANSAPCYQCYYCKKGQTNLCDNLNLLNGAYADYIKIPAIIARHNTHIIDATIPFSVAAFSEPLAVCLHGLSQVSIAPGDRVAVIGLGPIGQLMVSVCRLKGAHVTALARTDHKLQMAKEFGGAQQLVNLQMEDFQKMSETDRDADIVAHYTPEGRGFDVVIEAVGQPATWQQALNLVRKGGTVNCFGGCPTGSVVQFDTRRIHYDEIRIVSSFHHTPEQFRAAVNLLNTRQIDPSILISDTYPMARFEEALQSVEAGKAFKIALVNTT